MNKLLDILFLLPTAAIGIYLISEGKPALIAFGITLIAIDIVIVLISLLNRPKKPPKPQSD